MPKLKARATSMKRMAGRNEWEAYGPNDPAEWRERRLAEVLQEKDHVAAVRRFFVESIR